MYEFTLGDEQMAISPDFMNRNKDKVCLIFEDNVERKGYGGSAIFRDCPNAFGFITKKLPNDSDSAFFTRPEYSVMYKREINRLTDFIIGSSFDSYIVPALGRDVSNKYHIFEAIIEPRLKIDLDDYSYFTRFLF